MFRRLVLCAIAGLAVGETAPPSLQWSFTASDSVTTSPQVAHTGGMVVVGAGATVYALDEVTGAKRWSAAVGGATTTPALDERGFVYIGCGLGVCAFNDAGVSLWRYVTDVAVSAPALDDALGIVVVGTSASLVLAISMLTGAHVWSFAAGGTSIPIPVFSRVAAAAPLVIAAAGGVTHSLDAATGARRWSSTGVPSQWLVRSTPAVGADGTVYSGAGDFSLCALEGASGAPRWCSDGADQAWSAPALTPDGSALIAGSIDGAVHALATATGRELWNFTTGGGVSSAPAISSDGSQVYLGSLDFSVYALDSVTGALLWRFATGSYVEGSPALAANATTIFFGSFDGRVYALGGPPPPAVADSAALIAGLVAAAVAACICCPLVAALLCLLRRRQQQKQKQKDAAVTIAAESAMDDAASPSDAEAALVASSDAALQKRPERALLPPAPTADAVADDTASVLHDAPPARLESIASELPAAPVTQPPPLLTSAASVRGPITDDDVVVSYVNPLAASDQLSGGRRPSLKTPNAGAPRRTSSTPVFHEHELLETRYFGALRVVVKRTTPTKYDYRGNRLS